MSNNTIINVIKRKVEPISERVRTVGTILIVLKYYTCSSSNY